MLFRSIIFNHLSPPLTCHQCSGHCSRSSRLHPRPSSKIQIYPWLYGHTHRSVCCGTYSGDSRIQHVRHTCDPLPLATSQRRLEWLWGGAVVTLQPKWADEVGRHARRSEDGDIFHDWGFRIFVFYDEQQVLTISWIVSSSFVGYSVNFSHPQCLYIQYSNEDECEPTSCAPGFYKTAIENDGSITIICDKKASEVKLGVESTWIYL